MENPIIKTENLTKRYGSVTALNKLNLEIEKGEVYGLIGPNGSGKSTLILSLLGLTEPTSGRCTILGLNPLTNPLEVRQKVGYLPEKVGFYGELTGKQNLDYITQLNSVSKEEAEKRIRNSLKSVGLEEEGISKKVETYSHGMRQRLAIASILVKNPEIVFLDEPTTGLDPTGVKEMLDLIGIMKEEEDITILISSHLLHQVAQISDRIGMLIKGRKVAEKRISEIEEEVSSKIVIEVSEITDDLIEDLKKNEEISSVNIENGNLIVKGKGEFQNEAVRTIANSESSLVSLNKKKVELDEFYEKYSRR